MKLIYSKPLRSSSREPQPAHSWSFSWGIRMAVGVLALCLALPVSAQAVGGSSNPGPGLWATPILAQNELPQNGTGTESRSQIVTDSPSYALEIGLVVVLFGGALFAVCKSSRRA